MPIRENQPSIDSKGELTAAAGVGRDGSSRTVLLTGATGMVGSYVMAELLRHGVSLAVVVREKGDQSARQRVEQILAKFENFWQQKLPRPTVLEGDINQPNLGLCDRDRRIVASRCDRVLHSAASLSFAPADQSSNNEPYRTNVEGTRHVLRFCRDHDIRQFHHVSTAYVCGRRTGVVGEDELDLGQDFANDYERSKLTAESLLWDAAKNGDIRSLTIYRPSIVIDRIGLSPISRDRTIYGAFSMYQMLASRFGLLVNGEWVDSLGFAGTERKNLVDVDWVAEAIWFLVMSPAYHNRTYHLTSADGTTVSDLDTAFRIATEDWLERQTRLGNERRIALPQTTGDMNQEDVKQEIERMAEPFVNTFLPYLRDDPRFDRNHIGRVIDQKKLSPTPAIGVNELLEMVRKWTLPPSASTSVNVNESVAEGSTQQNSTSLSGAIESATPQPRLDSTRWQSGEDPDEIVICGYEVRLPGGVENADDFGRMLWEGRSGIQPMPEERLDRSLYFDSRRGIPGKTYTQLGGCVTPIPLDDALEQKMRSLGEFDLTHRQFAQVAVAAVRSAFGAERMDHVDGVDPQRAGIFVGHSGGTEQGGPLTMATLARTATELLEQTDLVSLVDVRSKEEWKSKLADAIRVGRPFRRDGGAPDYNAYSVASMTARLLGFRGRREVIDAACSSSLLAVHHAVTAMNANQLDIALVGGATFNNVDNLALFSQSGACSADGCYPFDRRASGLISSEGYVAVVLAKRSIASALGLPIHGSIVSVGIASDGKGKGLWAPRSEGQQLAIRRGAAQRHSVPGQMDQIDDKDATEASAGPMLNVDYLECHATSTQVGDATELESLTAILRPEPESNGSDTRPPLAIGSVKSNLGHLLEAAGLVGMVKCLIAMRQGELPASIQFQKPNETYDWTNAPVRVVGNRQRWPSRNGSADRVAGVNAFGIGGLNAHAVIRHERSPSTGRPQRPVTRRSDVEPIAIVGRGVVLPGAANLEQFETLLRSKKSQISNPPKGRWVTSASDGRPVGVNAFECGVAEVPHCRGAYIDHFDFNAQRYRIPPKTVRYANPAQLMLIEAVSQAMSEYDGGEWSVDRARVGVIVGTIFGGEFSNSLQIGLRIPEIREHLLGIARTNSLSGVDAERVAEQLCSSLLARFPALLDETGGFTASTLASRIARTFDLMGGACAVDADEASGGLAVLTAIEQLRSGHVDTMLCGVTHRSLDLVAFEELHRKNRLVLSGNPNDIPEDLSQLFPGEGVAVMMLQRLSDARSAGKTILGVIDQAGESWTDDVVSARSLDARQSGNDSLFSARSLVSQIGLLGGGQGVVRTIAATIAMQSSRKHEVYRISETAQDGYQINYQVSNQATSSMKSTITPQSTRSGDNARPEATESMRGMNAPVRSVAARSIRLQAERWDQIEQDLRSLIADPSTAPESGVESFASVVNRKGDVSSLIQAAIVGSDGDEISAAAKALLAGPVVKRETGTVARHLAWLRDPATSGDRIGWLFPGQGSQYAAVPSIYSAEYDGSRASEARDFLDVIDGLLKRRSLQSISDRLDDPRGQLGRDVWWTQLWVLAVGASLTNGLLRRGHRPDVVLGHSFGECTAAWCAGVMDIDQAIEFAKCRSDAVVMTQQGGGQLLSVRGEPSAIQAVLDAHQLHASISHHNSPDNTVVAGSKQDITAAKEYLSSAGMASVVISVPAAFHTPAMKPARELLRARFNSQRLMPPRFGFLSAVSNRYLAEPSEVMDNLIDQLTQPVCFNGAVERIVKDGCGLLIEVGPDDVLTRLAGKTVNGNAICLSADDRQKDFAKQQLLVDLACEAFGGSTQETNRLGSGHFASVNHRPSSNGHSSIATTAQPEAGRDSSPASQRERLNFEIVDVTQRKRRRVEVAPPPTSTMPISARAVPQDQSTNGYALASSQKPVVNNQSSKTARATGVEAARSFLFDLVVDLTGYDPEIIDFEADLEAELGVDSIKKAQLIGEMVQWGDLQLDTTSMQLARFETLDDILALVGDGEATASAAAVYESVPTVIGAKELVPEQTQEWSFDSSPGLGVDDADAESLRRLMIDLVVDQTGYDESIIDMEADLEGELGIDSIKKAQLLGELEQQYQLQALRESGRTLAEFPTLESIHAFVWEQISGEEKKNECLKSRTSSVYQDEPSADVMVQEQAAAPIPVPEAGTHRFCLSTHFAPRLEGMPTKPNFCGPALVLGSNPVADAIIARWRSDEETNGFPIHQISSSLSLESTTAKLSELWRDGVAPHLFLATPYDAASGWTAGDFDAWSRRRGMALSIPFYVCQRWMQGLIDEGRMSDASLATLVRAGGHLGFDLQGEPSFISAESGGLAGLTKAMLIEAWMRGYRDTPMLVLDSESAATPEEFVEGVWRELAVPSYDEEVVVAGAQRWATCARYRPLDAEHSSASKSGSLTTRYPLTRGGNWIIAGGGRGITAMTAMELASRHDLRLHLLGTAPDPKIDDQIRHAAAADRADLRRRVMKQVQSKGGNPVKAWQKLEKAIEIDQTLQACREHSIVATYHSVDVSDVDAVSKLLEKIRIENGPIRGVIQGAGAGQDARFDRKRPDKVEKCFRAKIDGAIALATATQSDPLEWFIGFGSISGRFGANGHTDYSAANDMLAKVVGNLGRTRPETRCVTFHWHAWGDIGMATKPEAKLALDMIGMKFMPAEEGLHHFLNEIEHGGDEPEVLITDRRYVRKFFPGGETYGQPDPTPVLPLLDPNGNRQTSNPSELSHAVTLQPTVDRFLNEHLVQGRPTLPFVMAIEMLGEAACFRRDQHVRAFHDVHAHQPLKCLTDDAFAVELVTGTDPGKHSGEDSDSIADTSFQNWTLVNDLRRRDGRLVQASRPHFSATVEVSDRSYPVRLDEEALLIGREIPLHSVQYMDADAPVYHGPSLQCLRTIGFCSESSIAIGTIVAPSPSHLAGEERPLRGWVIAPAAMDAVLYAAGMLAHQRGGRASLPISFKKIELGRLPHPGEPLRVIVQWEDDDREESGRKSSGGWMSAILVGQNRDLILRLSGYRIGWLG
ncbi:type I polyketide synthase [Aporhodopirellula aestuarii]|uniref:SDR family oxidoreductase n=1 Tax=Aporhodopirellula aestuarii TaxID=2950107 RepID=A0ABT0UBZ2_9BACT|nr:type I polyketide synthase [Aporhodopirellula aestuarii]MCM2373856.1 SDR family oxidoreductase [Aporhodopirellula aestuarii]